MKNMILFVFLIIFLMKLWRPFYPLNTQNHQKRIAPRNSPCNFRFFWPGPDLPSPQNTNISFYTVFRPPTSILTSDSCSTGLFHIESHPPIISSSTKKILFFGPKILCRPDREPPCVSARQSAQCVPTIQVFLCGIIII